MVHNSKVILSVGRLIRRNHGRLELLTLDCHLHGDHINLFFAQLRRKTCTTQFMVTFVILSKMKEKYSDRRQHVFGAST